MWVRSLFLAAILASGVFAPLANAQDGDRDRYHHGRDGGDHNGGNRGGGRDGGDRDGRGRGDARGDDDRGRGNADQRSGGFFYQQRGAANQGRGAWSGFDGAGGRPDSKGPQETRSERGGGNYGRDAIRPLREVVGMVRGRFGGDLINARLENGDRPFYVLRWRMQNGDVRDLTVDAASGQIR